MTVAQRREESSKDACRQVNSGSVHVAERYDRDDPDADGKVTGNEVDVKFDKKTETKAIATQRSKGMLTASRVVPQ